MARISASGRMTNAPTATLPGMSIYAAATSGGRLVSITVTNTTSTACVVAIRRLTTAGTQGAALDEIRHDAGMASAAPLCTVVNSHTVGPTIAAGEIDRVTLGASVGSGWIFTYGGEGLLIPLGTANGIGILCPTGTGQVCDVTFVWDE